MQHTQPDFVSNFYNTLSPSLATRLNRVAQCTCYIELNPSAHARNILRTTLTCGRIGLGVQHYAWRQ